ncbi:MAG TPA: glycosyltransferase family 9 protein [Fimbriimonadaceae bacterium]|nr:glycosyltransferase family 9 protein [Fimbriimonadaceae bacterium]HRJ33315.1 glycosyltransferase family 9 protein [Fimbriimonadaceae bacterium]
MRKFLICRLSSMGDVVCTLPVASALKTLGPDVEVTWAVDPRFSAPVRCCSAVDHVVEIKPKISLQFLRQVREILPGPFEAALDLQGLLKSASVVARVSASTKLSYHWQREGAGLFIPKVLPDPTSLHVVDQYVDVARALGAEVQRAQFDLHPDPDDLSKWRSRLDPLGEFVVLNAGAAWAIKRWPPESFAFLAQRLAERGIAAVFIGSKAQEDRDAFESVVQAGASKAISLIGETSIRELIAVISLARAHVGGDTGSTHIAAALGVPAVGLYSNNRPERTCPYGQRDRCHFHPESLAKIAPEPVWETLSEVLG